MLKKDCGYVEPGQKIECKPVELDLPSIKSLRYDQISLNSDNTFKDQGKEMALSIQPTTSGKYLSIKYEVETFIEYQNTFCSSKLPSYSIDLYLQPSSLFNPNQFEPPFQWNPQVIQSLPLTVTMKNEGGEFGGVLLEADKITYFEDDNTIAKIKKDIYNHFEEEKISSEGT